jgi:hypothetical protein
MAATKRDPRLVAALIAVQAVVGPLTIRDIARRSDEEIRGPRLLWQIWGGTNTFGAAMYWAVGRKR